MLIEKSGGGEQQPVGMVVRYIGPDGSVCSNFVARMPPREGIDSRFMVYLHAYLYGVKATNINVKQTTGIQNLDSSAYLSERCFVPPTDEQQAIADYLNTETARIDALLREKEGLIGLLLESKQSLISEVLSGERLPGGPSGCEWVPHLPAGWVLKRLKHLGQVRSGIAKGKDNSGKDTVEVPYLRVANVQDGYLDLEEISTIEVVSSEVQRYLLQPGDVLMNEGGDFDKLGRGAVWNAEVSPCIHQNHVFAVRPLEDGLSEWIAATTQTRYAKFYFINNAKQSTNLASISQTNLKELPVLLPPVEQRAALLAFVRGQNTRIDDLIRHAGEEIKLLKEFRAATIADAVLGRVDVRTLTTASAVTMPNNPSI